MFEVIPVYVAPGDGNHSYLYGAVPPDTVTVAVPLLPLVGLVDVNVNVKLHV
jgi:hypothetical protein